VSFDIDANGILHVTAKDKVSGKENKITIKANSGLTEAEIRKMEQDAAAHAEEDKRARELAESHNAGDALLHATRKTLAEHADRVDPATRDAIAEASSRLETALKGSDKADIDLRMRQLSTATQKLGARMYADAQQHTQGQNAGGPDRPASGANEEVVDADFKEVRK
jgi:molecular chaperone DnaK